MRTTSYLTAVTVLSFLLPTHTVLAQALKGGPSTTLLVRSAEQKPLNQRAKRLFEVPHVVKVEKYLVIRTKTHNVIGVQPGAPLRSFTTDHRIVKTKLVAGRGFRPDGAEWGVAIVGQKTAIEDYGLKAETRGKEKRPLELGRTFALKEGGRKVQVIGTYNAESGNPAMFLPLATAQDLFGKPERITYLVITLDDPAYAEEAARGIVKRREGDMGEKVEVLAR